MRFISLFTTLKTELKNSFNFQSMLIFNLCFLFVKLRRRHLICSGYCRLAAQPAGRPCSTDDARILSSKRQPNIVFFLLLFNYEVNYELIHLSFSDIIFTIWDNITTYLIMTSIIPCRQPTDLRKRTEWERLTDRTLINSSYQYELYVFNF